MVATPWCSKVKAFFCCKADLKLRDEDDQHLNNVTETPKMPKQDHSINGELENSNNKEGADKIKHWTEEDLIESKDARSRRTEKHSVVLGLVILLSSA